MQTLAGQLGTAQALSASRHADLGGPLPARSQGVMADLARMQRQLVQLVGAVRSEADAVHARGREIADDSLAQHLAASTQAQALGEAFNALRQEALGVQRGANAIEQAALQAAGARRHANEAQQVIAGAVERMQQRSTRLVQAVAAFRLDAASAPAAGAMLPTDGSRPAHPPRRRTFQPGRG
jgi:methyl-accepting chemotaxis protein-1 (serine sensor receptor)